ncbi:hypothetical protein INT47_000333 [Mucor saturninus]|uniref:NAD(P)-binding domain-containing protein n=1 Tax=Mucor saturninus TaxID=64648 RepID=A0A8H7QWH0_9FUNG|nr:hypothetical protein INT47_000333 [Mucor saturninus]
MVRVSVLGGSKGCSRAMVLQGIEQHQFKLLVRNPDTMDYTQEQKAKLNIVKGDALDPIAVKEAIINTDVLIFSIGSAFNFKNLSMVNPGLCHDAMKVVLDVVDELDETERPQRIVVISTTGLDDMSEVPYLFRPLYRLLHAPHQDKKALEALVQNENKHVADWIIVRPSLLTDGKLVGKYKADVGISGYTVSREDVGHFLLHQCIEPTTWIQKKVVVTY